MAQVLSSLFQPQDGPFVPVRLFCLLDPSDRLPGCAARFFGSHPLHAKIVFEQHKV
jgi:hypothetical protein